ncbi:hypothetical protein [Streptomyces hebeiensis]
MTSTFRASCAIAVLSVLLAAPGANGGETSPAPSAEGHPATAVPSEALAGHPAGEGRQRPGRPESGDARPGERPGEPVPSASPSARPSAAASPARSSAAPAASGVPASPAASSSRTTSRVTPPASASAGASPSGSGTDDGAATGETDAGGPRDLEAEEYREDAVHPPEPPSAPRDRPSGDTGTVRVRAVDEAMTRPVPVLTLGSGIVLLGLGVGFFGLRLRRR